MKRLNLKKPVIKKNLLQFVFSREQIEGGFSFVETTPPTLEDTYYAVGILKELNIKYSNLKTLNFIKKSAIDFCGPDHLFYLSFLYKAFNRSPGNIFYFNMSNIEVNSIESCYYMFRAYENLNKKIGNPTIENYLQKKNPFRKSYLSRVSKYIYLTKRMNIPINTNGYVRWISKSQNEDGGFGFKPGTTSFIENTYYGLIALSYLDSANLNINNCIDFIYSCHSKSGGFGRQKTTVPTLKNTYQALVSLKILDKIKNK
ncbi:MAG: Prenyltransferase and squalene oxidase repeat protein [Candidatus Methanofastidiosum methylothiophilum]|uniref:Geranylgeranyl transferase type II subunit beta n=1 Tax=Candidatus Methanofastidiosum methylothiophilum TaxID=1705564 RepID=A0A150IY35_9EURY|nr:MAG: Prenyltransferase and squalene oxidase repeat protein [Candidatus Methanofastidiosum methylthiophilus]KYC46706.1 MAG: Prenyltransferase and squalene oxidase repeat protein [Candidatus Methanofastidiosum methylthiophilus]KYC49812.1 MAG: Prenyltransferase and squalene oxidase repeat protein [Candidatus Methanofastidiosum methylthiophilus]